MRLAGRIGGVVGAVLGVMAVAGPALAGITQYECRFAQEPARGGGWIPEMLVLTDDDKTGETMVYDPIIKHFVGVPIKAKLEARTKSRATFSWEVKIEVRGQYSRMAYTFSHLSNGQAARMTARPGGYDNSFSGEGTCKVSKG